MCTDDPGDTGLPVGIPDTGDLISPTGPDPAPNPVGDDDDSWVDPYLDATPVGEQIAE